MADLELSDETKALMAKHPMKKHMDNIRKSTDAMEQHFRGQMEMDIRARAEHEGKTTSVLSPLGGKAKE